MLDAAIQRRFEAPLGALARRLAARGVQGEGAALAALAAGLFAAVLAGSGFFLWALAFLALNRLLGALEKAFARAGAGSAFSLYLSVTGDALFWGAFGLAFGFANPDAGLVAAVLVFSLMVLAVSGLAFALAGARRGLSADTGGALARLVEETEVAGAFALMCLLPGYFAGIAVLLALAALATAAFRTLAAFRALR